MLTFRSRKPFYLLIWLISISLHAYSNNKIDTCNDCYRERGYFVFLSNTDYNISDNIFIPINNPIRHITLEKLFAIKSWLYRQDNYELYKARIAVKRFNVTQKHRSYQDTAIKHIPLVMSIVPVEVYYRKYTTGMPIKESAREFRYQGKTYLIDFWDDWEVDVVKVKVIRLKRPRAVY